jgi:predicted acylesterase/phospholipase RssA
LRKVLDQAMYITQAEIERIRADRKPLDLRLVPDIDGVGFLDFYRGKEALTAGRAAAREKINAIKSLLETN